MLKRILDFILTPIPAAVGFLIGGLVVFFGGFSITQTQHDFLTVIKEGYSNFGIELVSIALTVLVIDRLNQRRANRERLQELITQMRSKDNGLALAAVELLSLKGWIYDGSLRGAYLSKANLAGAGFVSDELGERNLEQANLRGADLELAELEGANLRETNLEEANLGGANLQHAELRVATLTRNDLSGANLSNASLVYAYLVEANLGGADLSQSDFGKANLTNSDLEMANLMGTRFDTNTTLPDGSKWTSDTDMRRFTHPYEA